MWLQTPHTPLTILRVILLCCCEVSVIKFWHRFIILQKLLNNLAFFFFYQIALQIPFSWWFHVVGNLSLLNCFCIFLTPIFCVCVHRSRLHGLHLVHPGRQAGQGPPMWLVSHPWLRWRNQTPTWKVRYLTSQDYTHHLMQNLNEALWSYASLFIRLAQIAHDCAVKRKQFFLWES